MPRRTYAPRTDPSTVAVGDRYGEQEVIGPAVSGARGSFFPVMCHACGEPSFRLLGKLRTSESCGCQRGNRKHGMKRSRLYSIWSNMIDRCTRPTIRSWDRYGGRGITVCDAWQDFTGFRDWAMANGYADDLTLERVDNDGNYQPDNCKWIPRADQARNRGNSLRLEWDGQTKTLSDWIKDPRAVVSYHTAYGRIQRGWNVEKAVTTPPR